jgi:Domain of unknown function (DUF4190)/GYF domain 2
MFKIIGADGRQYGPVSAEQIRRWIAEGRANAQTLAQTEGSAEWKLLGSFSEFGLSAPPTIHVAPQSPPPTTNSMAVAGLVFGLLGLMGGWLCCWPLFSIFGVVFSSVGLSQIARNPLRETGRGIAATGLALSILGLLAGLILGVLVGTWRIWGRHPLYWHRQWHT